MQLLEMRAQDSLSEYVDRALLGIGSPHAVPGLIEALPHDPEDILRLLRALGSPGAAAGPAVMAYLDNPTWDFKVLAADVLGHIQYMPASASLLASLNNQDDWKLVYASSLALARLSNKEALDALEQVSETHWYPPVRAVAEVAIRHIRSGVPIDDNGWWRFGKAPRSPEACEKTRYQKSTQAGDAKLYGSSDGEALERLSYEVGVESYGAREGTGPNEVRADNMVQQIPDVAIKVEGGWLAGSDRGEWGGELVYISASGESTILYDANIVDIHQWGNQYVATAGLAHMGLNDGWLLRIEKHGPARYSVTQWKRLPAAPFSSRLTEGSELVINTYGGTVVVGEAGAMRMAQCRR